MGRNGFQPFASAILFQHTNSLSSQGSPRQDDCIEILPTFTGPSVQELWTIIDQIDHMDGPIGPLGLLASAWKPISHL